MKNETIANEEKMDNAGLLSIRQDGKGCSGVPQCSYEEKNLSPISSHDIRLDVANLLTVILENDQNLEDPEDRYFVQGALEVLDRLITRDLENTNLGIAGVLGGVC
jgi:hypothetical protein